MTKPLINIIDFATDKNLLGIQLYPEQERVLNEFWSGDYSLGLLALGRRAGKTMLAAISATYCATVLSDEYRQFLRPGEKWYSLAIATNLEQSKIFLSMVRNMLETSQVLAPMILRSTADQIELRNGCIFRSLPSSGRGSRGMAVGFLCLDEASHFTDSSGNDGGDVIYQSLSPSISQFGRLGKILLTSSPWLERGLFYTLYYKATRGELKHVYTVSEPSWVMNPTLSQDFLAEQKILLGDDVFSAEYGAVWTSALSSFLPAELIDSCVNHNRIELPPIQQFKGNYYCALDPAKGSRDDYCAAIVHYDGEVLVLDRWHQFTATWSDGGKKKQIDISQVENWIIEQNNLYSFTKVVLDQFNSQSLIQRLRGQMVIEELTWTMQSKIRAFTKLRELFNSRKIELYPCTKGIKQLKNLVVTYHSSGSWSISGGSGIATDDYALALAAAVLSAEKLQGWEWLKCYSMYD